MFLLLCGSFLLFFTILLNQNEEYLTTRVCFFFKFYFDFVYLVSINLYNCILCVDFVNQKNFIEKWIESIY